MSEGWRDIGSAPKDGTIKIPLTHGLATIVDAADVPLLGKGKWHASPRRDRRGHYAVNSAGVRMHRLLMGAAPTEIVDHIDGDGLNNTRANLRKGTQSQNCVNRKTTPGKYLRGVIPKKKKWRATIKYRGRNHSLGYFNTEQEAHAAYVAEARRLHGEWFPDEPLPLPPA